FGIGVLMVVAAFRPWLRFETMLFSTVEKFFMVYLFLSNLGQPWAMGYLFLFLVDATIVAYSILYFISNRGRPKHWAERGTLAGSPSTTLKREGKRRESAPLRNALRHRASYARPA